MLTILLAALGGCARGSITTRTPQEGTRTGAAPSGKASTDAGRMPLTATSLDAIVDEARRSNRPIALYFGTEWCAPCQAIERDVLPRADVKESLAKYRFAHYDAEIDAGAEASERLKVRVFPQLVFLDPAGNEVDRVLPPGDAPTFVRVLRDMLAMAALGAHVDAAVEQDPRRLLAAARIAQKTSDRAHFRIQVADKAARSTVGGPHTGPSEVRTLLEAAMAKDPKDAAGVRSEAAYRLLKLDARRQDLQAHAKLALEFAKTYPKARRSVDVLASLAQLGSEFSVDPAALAPLFEQSRAAMTEAGDGAALRRLARGYADLRDEERSRNVEAQAKTLPGGSADGFEPVVFGLSRDPLFSAPEPADMPIFPDLPMPPDAANVQYSRRVALALRKACRHEPSLDAQVMVRLVGRPGVTPRVIVLDPEAPAPLRTCLERAGGPLEPVPVGTEERPIVRVILRSGGDLVH
ncbi:MAG TPA: thioredoxin family protein [Labilithrix sp.]|nr:thioredoxin family protein [Labilithrix sp.]